jgi:hypothetical protein
MPVVKGDEMAGVTNEKVDGCDGIEKCDVCDKLVGAIRLARVEEAAGVVAVLRASEAH